MKATQQLHDLGQSLWLDNITRGLLTSGTLSRYIAEFSVTGLTSNPSIFDQAIKNAAFYDDAIGKKALAGKSGEELFFELALEDLTKAADLFRPIHDATGGVDGWVSLEVSPLLADDTAASIKAATQLHARAQRPNLFIKIPGTREGLPAIEETIFAGVPVNVTLLFSRGVPMLLGGDEFRRTQGGNNNAYCQNNETSWHDWSCLEQHREIFRFTRGMIAFRRAHPILSKEQFYRDAEVHWFGPQGGLPNWVDQKAKQFACVIPDDEQCALCLIFSAGLDAVDFNLPPLLPGTRWHLAVDTSREAPQDLFLRARNRFGKILEFTA
jgi:hypothetical protein